MAYQGLKMFSNSFFFCLVLTFTLPASASSLEEIPSNEDGAINQFMQMLEEVVRGEAKKSVAHRDAHAKAHGCVQAKFSILHVLPKC
jgi:hypothetical protein